MPEVAVGYVVDAGRGCSLWRAAAEGGRFVDDFFAPFPVVDPQRSVDLALEDHVDGSGDSYFLEVDAPFSAERPHVGELGREVGFESSEVGSELEAVGEFDLGVQSVVEALDVFVHVGAGGGGVASVGLPLLPDVLGGAAVVLVLRVGGPAFVI